MNAPPAPVLLLTAWHLRSMRATPRAFWGARRLERNARSVPGCVLVHRWVSRRSILLSSWWATRAAAEAWLASPAFRRYDQPLRAIRGTHARVEIRDAEQRPSGPSPAPP